VRRPEFNHVLIIAQTISIIGCTMAGIATRITAWLRSAREGGAARPHGFSEGQAPVQRDQPAVSPTLPPGATMRGPYRDRPYRDRLPEERRDDLPFPSTGPHGHRQRLRAKLLERGPDALADYELLEMLLFFAMPKGDTKPLAKSLVNRFGSFAAVLAAPQQELLATRGLGEHSVAAIKLVQAAALRLSRAEVMDAPVLNNAERLESYLAGVMSREKVEQFRVLFLDPKNRLIADEVQGRGTVNHTPVYAREVVKRALELHATALILVHNHPSGDPTPSRGDIEMTAEIGKVTTLLGIVLHDHIIIGNGRRFSFRREGMLARA
jgi:DNA repair protein RadC